MKATNLASVPTPEHWGLCWHCLRPILNAKEGTVGKYRNGQLINLHNACMPGALAAAQLCPDPPKHCEPVVIRAAN